jgi:hypothetical protein
MHLAIAFIGVVLLAGAGFVGNLAREIRADWPHTLDEPYAPSAAGAPFFSLGYRELAADLLWIRMIGYWGGKDDTSEGVARLIEAANVLDPKLRSIYDVGAEAIGHAEHGVNNASHLRSIAVLERGMHYYPEKWLYPFLAGQIYIVEMSSDDPEQTRAWTERGIELLEHAVRLPGAPVGQARLAAHLMSTLGKRQAAIDSLRELILITTDDDARAGLIAQLAKIEEADAAEVAIAILDEREAFLREWRANRPAVPATMYILIGPRRDPYLPPSALAVDRDLIGANVPETLEPLSDP